MVLEFLAALAGNLVAGWLQQDVFQNAFSLWRVVGTIIGAIAMLLLIVWLEKKPNLKIAKSANNPEFKLPSIRDNPKDMSRDMKYDVFISHASENKDDIVRPLAQELRKAGYSVWFDEFSLSIGDSLRESIDNGLANSRYGIVVLSKPFFEKKWPQSELNALFSRQIAGSKVILPIRHEISHSEILEYSPLLSDLLAIPTQGTNVEDIVARLKPVLDTK